MNEIKLQSSGPADTAQIAVRLAGVLRGGDLICLRGDMGSGKTTFVQGLARGLGSSAPVTSPTFTLLQEYRDGRIQLVHGDAYRLKSGNELLSIGFEEYVRDTQSVVVLEWPEHAEDILGDERLDVYLDDAPLKDDERTITLCGVGPRWAKFVQEWEEAA